MTCICYIYSEYKREQAICYITALQWILDYYYRGVRSWGWYYPHHYAPFISDLKNFRDHEIKFERGKPFLPFQQVNIFCQMQINNPILLYLFSRFYSYSYWQFYRQLVKIFYRQHIES